jgi:hypothetical protein
MITIEDSLELIQKLLDAGVLTQISENCAFFGRPAAAFGTTLFVQRIEFS